MTNKTMSDNACYALNISVPLCFNSAKHYLGFTSTASSDVSTFKYSFYGHKGLYWYSISLDNGHILNSLFFSGFGICVRDFRCLCNSIRYVLDDSFGLKNFCALYNSSQRKGGI